MEIKQMPWGFEGVWANTEAYSAKTLIVKNGERTPYVYHKNRIKTIFVLQGVVLVTSNGTTRILEEGDSMDIMPQCMNRVAALQGDATLLEVGTAMEEEIIVEDDYSTR